MVPSGQPEVTLYQLDLVSLRITRCLSPVRKCLGMQAAVNTITFQLQQEPLVRSTVECLARSRKTSSVGRDKLRDLAQSFNDDNICVTVDLPFRKLHWLLFIRPVSCQKLCNLSKTIFSPILQTTEVRKIGR